ncbi:MAG: IS3 family transposase [Nitrospira sp.]|nr:IS3 family transposase [Nitrospira sp.]
MATTTRRHFTDAFKVEAVRLTRESGRPVAQVARELGISDNVLYRWRSEQQQAESQGRTRQAVRAEQDELTRLRRENETLRQERDFLKRAAGVLREGIPMRYRAIQEQNRRYPIRLMCRALAVSAAGYYAWRSRPESARSVAARTVLSAIRVIHRESRETYGSPSIWDALLKQGHRIGEHRVARLMRQDGIRAKTVKKWRATTQSQHRFPVAANTLDRQFTVEAPNRVWAGDLTYVWTTEGWLYLAVLLDLYSRAVVGWAMGPRVTGDLTEQALRMALTTRQPQAGLLHHSDRGSQYAARPYQQVLTTHGITASMSRKGNCWDNACVESFFGTLKRELVYHRRYATREEATQDIFEYIEVFYNRKRRHSTLGYDSPAEFEARTAVA